MTNNAKDYQTCKDPLCILIMIILIIETFLVGIGVFPFGSLIITIIGLIIFFGLISISIEYEKIELMK